jgi:excisionase family DNA binding protein
VEGQDQHTRIRCNGGLLSLNDLAEYLSCSRTYAAGLISSSTIPSVKLGSLRRARKCDVDRFISAQLAEKD